MICDTCNRPTSKPKVVDLSPEEKATLGGKYSSFTYCPSCWASLTGAHAIPFMVNTFCERLRLDGVYEREVARLSKPYREKLTKLKADHAPSKPTTRKPVTKFVPHSKGSTRK